MNGAAGGWLAAVDLPETNMHDVHAGADPGQKPRDIGVAGAFSIGIGGKRVRRIGMVAVAHQLLLAL